MSTPWLTVIDGEAVACDDNELASFERICYRQHDVFLYDRKRPPGERCGRGRRPPGGLSMTEKRNSWWSKLSKWDDPVEKEWIQWIELVAGLSAMIVLTLSLLAVWDGQSP
jgi:hypothetical protein